MNEEPKEPMANASIRQNRALLEAGATEAQVYSGKVSKEHWDKAMQALGWNEPYPYKE